MISKITRFIKKILRKRKVTKIVHKFGFKKNITAKKVRVQCIFDFMSKERINLYIFSDQRLKSTDNLLAIIRDKFEVWRISKIIGKPCLKELEEHGFFCVSANVQNMNEVQKELLTKENTKVLVCWNGGIKNITLFAIWRLKTLKKAFWLYKQNKDNYTLEHFDRNGNNPNYAAKTLAKKAEEYLKEQNILYIRQISRSGSGTIYLVTDKWFRIRISNHPSKYSDNSQLKTFNMGLFPGTDGFLDHFKSWLHDHKKNRVFGISPHK
jgi:hypothetical protein